MLQPNGRGKTELSAHSVLDKRIWSVAYEYYRSLCCAVTFFFSFLHICLAFLFPSSLVFSRSEGRASRHLAGSPVSTEMTRPFLLPISQASPRSLQHPLATQYEHDELAAFHASPFYGWWIAAADGLLSLKIPARGAWWIAPGLAHSSSVPPNHFTLPLRHQEEWNANNM